LSRVAVIVTCYDLGRTLGEAVASAQRQTVPPAELVVVDDGSGDAYTRQVLADLERSGTWIERLPHSGVAAARNHGVRATTSPYLLMLDADDELTPTCLERMASVLEADPGLDVVSCAMRSLLEAHEVWEPPPFELAPTLAGGGFHAASMFRRSLFMQVGGFDEELEGHEDLDFWLAALLRGCRGRVLPEPLLAYGVRARSRQRLANRRATYLRSMAAIHAKHRRALLAAGAELLIAKDAALAAQQDHARHLAYRRAVLERERDELAAQVAEKRRQLAELGEPTVDAGELRRLTPLSPTWGLDRGKPVDRHYIEAFLDRHRADVRGCVLEVKDAGYTRCYGGDRVTNSDVLDVDAGNAQATVVADLSRADTLEEARYDCFILTQTLGVIFDVRAALRHALRVLKPGGVLLATLPATGRVSYEDGGLDGDYWRFAESGVRRLFAELLPPDAFEVAGWGNVLVDAAFYFGLAAEELTAEELAAVDPYFPLIYTVRAVKPVLAAETSPKTAASVGRDGGAAAILLYHRIGAGDGRSPCPPLPPADLRAQLEHLRRHYQPVPLADLVAGVRRGRLPERAVAITFDDGTRDALTEVSPLLCELGLPATFFVTTDRLSEEHELWWDVVDGILFGDDAIPPSLDLGQESIDTATAEQRRVARKRLHEILVPLPWQERDELLRRLRAWVGSTAPPRPSHRVLLASEVVELASRPGHEIGGHSVHHLFLPSHRRDVQRLEIARDKESLEVLLDRPLRSFCYPFGGHDAITVEVVRDCAYRAAVTVESRAVTIASDPFRLPRCEVTAAGVDALEAQLASLLGARGGGRAGC
jgi:peptidoglycan/xylan/chitin deacetylase (PgdA/CDA1 family)/GT2 family glycosyltransferase/SAM-dependent methyltransferase